MERPYKVLAYPLIPAAYILLAGGVAVCLMVFKTENSMAGLGIVALGVPVYLVLQRFKKPASQTGG
jgi:APA family basic amino acid/polyamine antiporter